jgi:hypothetical protein
MRHRAGLPVAPLSAPVLSGALLLLLVNSAHARAQDRTLSPGDSADLVEKARDRQRDFELFRQSRIPVEPERSDGTCDQRIGRICIWFGGDEEADFPPERPETEVARRSLIGTLLETTRQVKDPWVIGQLVHYLVEQRDFRLAETVAGECGIAAAWWCSALIGYSLHVRGEFVRAEAAFREALGSMPEDERLRWLTPRYVLSRDAEEGFRRSESAERERQWELLWRLSDPLFAVDGNDRLTDHYARWVVARNHEDAENPQMFWEEDLEETLIRYGRIMGWSRTHAPGATVRPGRGFNLQDTRRVVGHHHPRSRGYLFPEEFLASPSDIPPESWITAPREARTWYAPPYAPDFRGLETQVGRFRRGDEMLVVGAYRPAPDTSAQASASEPAAFFESALFLVPEDGGDLHEAWGILPEGVLTLLAPPGRYVSSLEVMDPEARQAWRARQGVKQEPMIRGLVAVSDLMILQEGAPPVESLEEAIPHVRPGVRIARGERFSVVWEVYGLGVEDPARVTIGFTRGRPGFLTRVGEFLGMLEPDRPVEVTFADPGGDRVQSAFRTVFLELPDLEPGEYTLHLRLDLPGREPSITSRPILVME